MVICQGPGADGAAAVCGGRSKRRGLALELRLSFAPRTPPLHPEPCPVRQKPHSGWCPRTQAPPPRPHPSPTPTPTSPRLHPEQVHLRQGLVSYPASLYGWSLCLGRSPRRVPGPRVPQPRSRGGGCMPVDASSEDPLLPPTPLSTQRLKRGCQKPGSRTPCRQTAPRLLPKGRLSLQKGSESCMLRAPGMGAQARGSWEEVCGPSVDTGYVAGQLVGRRTRGRSWEGPSGGGGFSNPDLGSGSHERQHHRGGQ